MLNYRNAGGAAVGIAEPLSRLLSRVHYYHLFAEGDVGDAGGGSGGAGAGDGGAGAGAGGVIEKRPALGDGAGAGGDDGGARAAGGDAGGDAPTWREDWRETLAGEDETFGKQLKRFSTPENFAKSYRELQKKLLSGQTAATLPEGATDVEVAAYRKVHGIPEKAEGYALAFPQEIAATDADKAVLAAYQEYVHKAHVPPAAAKAAFEFYTNQMQANRVSHAEAAQEATLENIGELRAAFPGREFKRNMTIAEDFLGKHFEGSESALDTVLEATLPNGVKVKNFAPFIKGLVGMARSYADEEALLGGDGGGGGKSLDDEYKDLIDKSATPGQKLTESEQKRLMQIAEARSAREAKQGRARAA